MIAEKKTAARLGQQAASKTEFQNTLYNKASPLSSLKSEIGELLFCLEFPVGQELRHVAWRLLEKLLRQYVDLRLLPQSEPEHTESTNAGQRVSG